MGVLITDEDTFFTSDTHFGHANIIKYCERPFQTVTEMNEAMIENWNHTVSKDSVVFHLGDFAFGPVDAVRGFRNRLNGRIILIGGNHDRIGKETLKQIFDAYYTEFTLYLGGKILALSHRPADLIPPGVDIALNGHVHHVWKYSELNGIPRINVGVDQWEFKPRKLKELIKTLDNVETDSTFQSKE